MRTSSRPYAESHPWLSFKLDLKRLDYEFWLALGEVQSKIEHVANSLLPPPVGRRLHSLYLAKGVHGTTAIEGNTLSEKQVRDRIHGRGELPPSQEYQGTEIDNIVAACNEIGEQVWDRGDHQLTAQRVKEFNRLVLEGLRVEEGVVPGRIRQHSVAVMRYRGAPAQDCEYLVERLCDWIRDTKRQWEGSEIAFAVIQAIVAHLYIAWIHPFGDGNGRTARLVEFQILISANVPSIAAHLLSNHYNQTRTEYYRQLDYTSKSGGDLSKFLAYALEGLRDGLVGQIREIRKHQQQVAWRDFVHNSFRDIGGRGPAIARRRTLALELGRRNKGVTAAEIMVLTPELAKLYADKTTKTVSRDVNVLREMNLVLRTGRRVLPKRSVLKSLLPRRRRRPEE